MEGGRDEDGDDGDEEEGGVELGSGGFDNLFFVADTASEEAPKVSMSLGCTYMPKTRRIFDRIDPTREDCTTASSHYILASVRVYVLTLIKAKIATINSTAFPSVALSSPPSV